MPVHEVKIGDTVRDAISGYEGVVIGRTEWIYGCIRFTVQTQGLHEGKPIDPVSLDEGQAIWVKSALPVRKPEEMVQQVAADKPGGPSSVPGRRAAAARH